MQDVDQGKINLDTTISDLIPSGKDLTSLK